MYAALEENEAYLMPLEGLTHGDSEISRNQ